jgi:carotenoid cleavage dioxygenase-like enzyme
MRFSGKALFAFKEDSLPVALDPITLETRGEWAAGPIATVRLPVRLRSGLHGNWYSNEQLGI